jgi:hypothetical protein
MRHLKHPEHFISAGLLCAAVTVALAAGARGLHAKPGDEFRSFVPGGYSLLAFEKGDLNEDGLDDAVLILDPPNPEDDRLVYVLEARKTGMRLAAKGAGIAYCARCGGAFGDPFENPSISNGTFTIHNYGGSALRWGHSYSFRKIKGAYRLISYSFSTFRSAEECTDQGMAYDLLSGTVDLSRDFRSGQDGTDCSTEAQTVQAPVLDLLLENQADWKLPNQSSYGWFFYPKGN